MDVSVHTDTLAHGKYRLTQLYETQTSKYLNRLPVNDEDDECDV